MPAQTLSVVVTITEAELLDWAHRYVSGAEFDDIRGWWINEGSSQLTAKCKSAIKSVIRGSDRAIECLKARRDERVREEEILRATGDAMSRLPTRGG